MRIFAMTLCVGLLVGMIPCHAETAVRVMTYNIRHAEGTDGKVDLDRIAKVIRAAQADVVCLQEVDRNCERSGRLDFPALLAQKLNMNVAFGANLKLGGGDYGNATLTRFKIAAQENVALPGKEGAEPRGCLKTTLEVDGQQLDVWNAHLGLDAAERKAQAAALFERLGNKLTILAGDMNETQDGAAVTMLLGRLADTWLEHTGEAVTTIGKEDKAQRIDFILVSKDINVLSSRILVTPEILSASDHLPYTAELALPKRPETAADRGVRGVSDGRVEEAVTGRKK